MHNIMGIIMTSDQNPALKELIEHRCTATLPLGGKYSVIDFVLSNMVNAGIYDVGLVAQYKFRSLIHHIGSGKEWDLDRKNGGITILTPYLGNAHSGWYHGTADALHQNLSFLKNSTSDYVVICRENCIYKLSYTKILDFHLAKNADITVAYKQMDHCTVQDFRHAPFLQIDGTHKILGMQPKSFYSKKANVPIGVCLLKRELCIQLVEACAAPGNKDMLEHIFMKKIPDLNIYAYPFKGYWKCINTVQSYYKCNMDLLNLKRQYELFKKDGPIYTRTDDSSPAKYCENADVRNSLIAGGCHIKGRVQNSILFPGVTVGKGAVVKNSIVMHNALIEEDVLLTNAIVDKKASITHRRAVKGVMSNPILIGSEGEGRC